MSNVMSLKQIKNKPNRSAFDLSFRKCFTAKVGEILPVGFKEVIPGDKFKIKLNSFTRTQPVNSAAFTRIKEYYDYFFVPYRYLWRYFDQFITQTSKSNTQFASGISSNYQADLSQSPFFYSSDIIAYLNAVVKSSSRKNEFGFNRDILSYKLLKYLGYGLFSPMRSDSNGEVIGYSSDTHGISGTSSIRLNPFPLLAYQKICQDYFRNTQWENSNPSVFNVDYLNSSVRVPVPNLQSSNNISKRNMFDLNYCTWDKDLFTGLLPAPQYGDTATISNGALSPTLSGVLHFTRQSMLFGDLNAGNGSMEAQDYHTDSTAPRFVANNATFSMQGNLNEVDGDLASKFILDSSDISGFNVLALRQAEALQKWREISLSGKQDYKDQIEKHFGVSVPDVRSNLCTWLGGNTSVIDIGEVVNTNLQGINDKDSSVAADIAGRGVGSSSQSVDFDAKEHGIIMCLYHSVPLMDYSDEVTDLYMFKTRPFDYAIPEFDSVGMQSVPGISLNSYFSGQFASLPTDDSTSLSTDAYNSLGYAPRYVDYKTSVDVVTGDFCDTLKYWAAPMSSDYFKKLSAIGDGKLSPSFFKCNPSLLDTIFAVAATGDYRTDNLLVSCFQDIKAVRNLDYNGLPY